MAMPRQEGNYKYGIAWKDSYKVWQEPIDTQHRRLFELLSELVGSSMDGSNVQNLQETLEFLVDYTIRHFEDEEDLQTKYDYPDYRRHKQLHEDFKVTVGSLVHRFKESGSSSELCDNINKIVVKWLVSHIMQEDMKIGKYIKEK
jgi:hemerythrin